MSRWFRYYEDAVNDPKVQLLSGDLFKAWVNVLCLASMNDGWLPHVDHIAYVLRITEKRATDLIDELLKRSLLDEYDGKLTPHNWGGRQHRSDVSTDRVKRFRKRSVKRDETVSPTVSETPPETEQIGSEAKASGASAPPVDPKSDLFARGRQILGPKAGGQISKLLKSLGDEDDLRVIAKARAHIETASTKAQPAEWIGRILNGKAAVLTPEGQPYPDGII